MSTAIEKSERSTRARTLVRRPPEPSNLQFDRSEVSLFRSLSTLAQKAGVPGYDLPKLALKELVDNAIDAGSRVSCERDRAGMTWVKDDGCGIAGTDNDIAQLFSIGRPLRSSKLFRLPTRGALGNGLRVLAGLVLCTGGRLIVRTRGRELRLKPLDNGATRVGSSSPWAGVGTEIGVCFGEFQEGSSEDDMLEWARLAAAHMGESDYRGKSSPFWYDPNAFFELCAAAPRELSVRALVEQLDGCSGRKAGEIASAFRNRAARALTRTQAQWLLATAQQHARPVAPKRLGVVGEQPGFPGYGKALGTVFVQGAALPAVVEAWAVGRLTDPGITLLVNRTPAAAAFTLNHRSKHLQVTGCHYVGELLPTGGNAYRVEVNVQTPYMPITSDGKAPELTQFKALLDAAIRSAIGRAKKAAGITDEPRGDGWAFKDSVLEHLDEAITIASSDGQYRFNLRNLFYQVRPFVMHDKGELHYATFANIITDHERETGPIAGMYRDERGTLIHPHSREQVRLGTLTVEQYERPPWRFNKVLYVEKEGFFQTLLADGWPERHDCALMTSKGFASRAARDLIDALGDHAERIQIFCLHDADAFGTKIFESLQEATRARPERKVRIVNLGLERSQAEAMGLEVERLPKAKVTKPTADYVSRDDHEWYQTHRFELNAIKPEALLAWLDEQLETRADEGKVVPPSRVLSHALKANVETRVRMTETARILDEAGLDGIVADRMRELAPAIDASSERMAERVGEHFASGHRRDPWTHVVEVAAEDVIGGAP